MRNVAVTGLKLCILPISLGRGAEGYRAPVPCLADRPPQLQRPHDGVGAAGGGRHQNTAERIEKRRSTKTLHRNVAQSRNTKGVGTLPLRLRATFSCYAFVLRL